MATAKKVEAEVVKFWDSALGQSFQVLLWAAASAVVAVVLKDVNKLSGSSLAYLVPAVNAVAYAANSFLVQKNVPNLPTAVVGFVSKLVGKN